VVDKLSAEEAPPPGLLVPLARHVLRLVWGGTGVDKFTARSLFSSFYFIFIPFFYFLFLFNFLFIYLFFSSIFCKPNFFFLFFLSSFFFFFAMTAMLLLLLVLVGAVTTGT
jgi:hypothetical protein